ncbi:hypothetical protein pb186bvf_017729 [Paramecium bursaria]
MLYNLPKTYANYRIDNCQQDLQIEEIQFTLVSQQLIVYHSHKIHKQREVFLNLSLQEKQQHKSVDQTQEEIIQKQLKVLFCENGKFIIHDHPCLQPIVKMKRNQGYWLQQQQKKVNRLHQDRVQQKNVDQIQICFY